MFIWLPVLARGGPRGRSSGFVARCQIRDWQLPAGPTPGLTGLPPAPPATTGRRATCHVRRRDSGEVDQCIEVPINDQSAVRADILPLEIVPAWFSLTTILSRAC